MIDIRPLQPEDHGTLAAMMVPYFEGIIARVNAIGGPKLDAEERADKAMQDLPNTLPPNGQTFMAWEDGQIIGTGALKILSLIHI